MVNKLKKIKTAVILAGGKGTRLSEHTKTIPKPLVEVHGKPIMIRIMEHLAKYGIEEFYILGGYLVNEIYSHFLKNIYIEDNLKLTDGKSSLRYDNEILKDCSIEILDTGLESGTAERVYQLKNRLKNTPFILTYGDTYSDVDLSKIEEILFSSEDKVLSLCGVPYSERFGLVKVHGNDIVEFKEKSESKDFFVNGGFICLKPEIFDIIKPSHKDFSKNTLESEELKGKMGVYVHKGFWKAVDTQRDLDELNKEFLNKIIKGEEDEI